MATNEKIPVVNKSVETKPSLATSSGTMSDIKKTQEPVVLIVLDGWGVSANRTGNAILHANPPVFTRLWNEYPHQVLQAFSPVDAAAGQVGASDIGHTSMGTGRMVHSDISDISLAISSGDFFNVPTLKDVQDYVLKERVSLHLIGLTSNGGVHSHIDHLYGLLEFARRAKLPHVFVHAITDGIDVANDTAQKTLNTIETLMTKANIGQLASVSGRDWAMDRNGDWRHTNAAYKAMLGVGAQTAHSLDEVFHSADECLESDHDLTPTVMVNKDGSAIGSIKPKDAVIIFNTRPDRMMQLVQLLANPAGNAGLKLFRSSAFVGPNVFTMTDYQTKGVRPLFNHAQINDNLARVLSDHGVSQARIATHDREMHVTYYFNGGRSEPYPDESRYIVAGEFESGLQSIVKKALPIISSKKQRFIMINLDNVDRTAHGGDFIKTTTAVQAVDQALGKITDAVIAAGGICLITADHGNAESMLKDTIRHRHTSNGVPFIFVSSEMRKRIRSNLSALTPPNGVPGARVSLADIAPTILALFGISKPTSMTGTSLVPKAPIKSE